MMATYRSRILPSVSALLCACTLVACAHADDGVRGRDVEFAGNPFHVVTVDLQKARLALHWRDSGSGKPYADIKTLQAWGEQHRQRLLFATNAGIYAHNGKPLGLYVEQKKTLIPLNKAHGDPSDGNFSLLPNGVFFVDVDNHAQVTTTKAFDTADTRLRLATQSGPMLLIDGAINPHFQADSTSIKWRSGVCAPSPGKVVFAISETPVNFHTFAHLFRDILGCRDALYLDGSISRLYDHGDTFGAPAFMIKPYAGMFAVFAPE